MSLLDTAELYNKHNLNVLPVHLSDKRPAIPEWKSLQEKFSSQEEVQALFAGTNGVHGIAVVCGKISLYLHCIDFDNKLGNIEKVYKEFCNIPEVNEIVRQNQIVIEKTQSGGYHFVFRCRIEVGNEKLARAVAPKTDGKAKIETIIETRGEGGYFVCAPSKGYELIYGSYENVPEITQEEYFIMIQYCKSFNEYMPENNFKEISSPKDKRNTGIKPGEAFADAPEAADEVRSVLEENGWKMVYRRGENEYYRRPGKNKGVSASFNGKIFYNFSANGDPFDVDKGYSPFQVYGLLKHNGNFGDAARELLKKGYGQSSQVVSGNDERFWIETTADKNGVIKYNIEFNLFIKFLADHGFYKMVLGQDFILVRVVDNIADEVQLHQIIDFIKGAIEDEMLLSFIIKSEKVLFTMSKMAFLPVLSDNFNSDTPNTGWFYFRNVVLKIDSAKDSASIFDYKELPRPIWRKKIIDRDFVSTVVDDETPGEFETFLTRICRGNTKKLYSLMAAIGYMLHGFKTQSVTRAIVFVDEMIPDNEDDANGGTGKSIVAKYLAMYKSTVSVSGKASDFKNSFFYQDVSLDTDIILFDDVNQKFPFSYLFDVITGDLKVEKKNKTPFIIPFAQGPKFLITTNYTIQGTGNSYDRRKYEIEFSSHYNASCTPRKEFGHDLLTEWSETEQAKADLFAIKCLKLFLTYGLGDNSASHTTIRIRQCISETSREFFEFMMDEIENGSIKTNVQINRKDIYSKYLDQTNGGDELKVQTFSKWLNKFSEILKIKTIKKKSGSERFTLFVDDLTRISDLWQSIENLDLNNEY